MSDTQGPKSRVRHSALAGTLDIRSWTLEVGLWTILFFTLGLSAANGQKTGDHLLETGRATKLQPAANPTSQLKLVSYNIRWRAGEDLDKLIQLFRQDKEIGRAQVLALQEVDRNKKRTAKTNTARLLAEKLGMHYAWAAPPQPKQNDEEETGVALMSAFPLTQIRRIVLPHPGPGQRRRVALGATINTATEKIRVYSIHSETRIDVKEKIEQMKAVLADLRQFPADMPAIVAGDLNTWEPSSVTKTFALFKAEGFQTPFDDESTFCRDLLFFDLKLKLDWIWSRGFDVVQHGIVKAIKISDHWPLTIEVHTRRAERKRQAAMP